MLQAVVRIGSRALKNNVMRGLAAVAFVALFLFSVPFPLVILAAGFVGYAGGRARHPAFLGGSGHGSAGGKPVPDAETALGEHIPEHARPNLRWSLRISGVLLALWITPVLALVAALGPHNVFSEIALFFSKMAVVTFGGAYAVLAYVAQQGVEHYGWLRPGEMLDGLGMAETTPGPLIMVVAFAAFIAGWLAPPFGADALFLSAATAAVVVSFFTFLPSFVFILAGGPLVEGTRGRLGFTAPLAAISAAVVGVIVHLALFFADHVLWPAGGGLNDFAAVLAAAAAVALMRFRVGVLPVLAACAAAGLLARLLGQ